jgi:hemerythrin-like domain-containing protein
MTEATDIGEMLHAEHLHTLTIANALEERIEDKRKRSLDPAQPEDARFIDDLIAAIDNDIQRHFRFEEEVLFPMVNEAGLGEVTAMLIDEHVTIWSMADELRSLAEAARHSPLDAQQWSSFRDIAMDFVNAEMFHIQKEEMSILRELSMTIGNSNSRELAARYAAFRSEGSSAP